MNKSSEKRSRPSLQLALAAISCVLGSTSLAVFAEGAGAPVIEPCNVAPAMKAYADPETGELLEEPRPGAELSPVENAGGPAPKLEQIESPEPGGGVMVDVKGRFQTPMTVTIDPQGKPVIGRGDAR